MFSEIGVFVLTLPEAFQAEELTEKLHLTVDALQLLAGTLTAQNVCFLKQSFPNAQFLYHGPEAVYVNHLKSIPSLEVCTDYLEVNGAIHDFRKKKVSNAGLVACFPGNLVSITAESLNKLTTIFYSEQEQLLLLYDTAARCTGIVANYLPSEQVLVVPGTPLQQFLPHLPVTEAEYIPYNFSRLVATNADFRFFYQYLSERGNASIFDKVYFDVFTELFIDYKELLK